MLVENIVRMDNNLSAVMTTLCGIKETFHDLFGKRQTKMGSNISKDVNPRQSIRHQSTRGKTSKLDIQMAASIRRSGSQYRFFSERN